MARGADGAGLIDVSLLGAGLNADEERVYRLLVTLGTATVTEITARLGLAEAQVESALATLTGVRLVTAAGSPAGFTPTPPDVGFAPLLLRSTEAVDRAREAVSRLTDEYRATVRRRDAHQLVEVVTGVDAIRQQLRTLQLSTREEILWFCRAGHVAMPSSENEEEYAMLARGVSYRVIYERALLEEPGMLDDLARGLRAGEVARAHPALPLRMAIADRSIALCPLVSRADGLGEPTAALVRDSNLLTALLSLFERYWETSSPLTADQGTVTVTDRIALDHGERELLSLLVAGVGDKAVASRLEVSIRTVQRRISQLMERTGARTRMQLAWQAADRGWLRTEQAAPAEPADEQAHQSPRMP